jgi:endonuclease-3
MLIKNIDTVFKLLKKESKKWKNPFVTELQGFERNPFNTLISCILSLRTKDDVTANASKRILSIVKKPETMLRLPLKKIEQLIYPVGFYRTKAKRLKEICKVLVEKYNSRVPAKFDELVRLNGIGPKTASIVIVYGHKKPEFIPVDVHVHVISNRLGWVRTKTPEKTMEELMKVIPKKYWYDLNDLFVQFGQNICITVSPLCSRCPVMVFCPQIGVDRSR